MRRVNGLHHITAIAGSGAGKPRLLCRRSGHAAGQEKRQPGRSRDVSPVLCGRRGSARHRPDVFPLGAHGAAAPWPRPRGRSRPRGAGRKPRLLGRAAAAVRRHASSRRNTVRRPSPPGRSIRTACGSSLVEAAQPAVRSRRGTTARSPAEHQVRGLHSGRLWERDAASTASFLTGVLGFEALGAENGWTRYGFPNVPGAVDIREAARRRGAAPGASAACTILPGEWTTRSTRCSCVRRWRRRARTRRP